MPKRKNKVSKKHKVPPALGKSPRTLTTDDYLSGVKMCEDCQSEIPFRGNVCVTCMETRDLIS